MGGVGRVGGEGEWGLGLGLGVRVGSGGGNAITWAEGCVPEPQIWLRAGRQG